MPVVLLVVLIFLFRSALMPAKFMVKLGLAELLDMLEMEEYTTAEMSEMCFRQDNKLAELQVV